MFKVFFDEAIRRGYGAPEAYFVALVAVFSCSTP